jgi:hypothetical protein
MSSCNSRVILQNVNSLSLACLLFFDGSDMFIGTPPAARASCGFTAAENRLFVFAGESTLPNQAVSGENEFPSNSHLWCCMAHKYLCFFTVSLNDLHQFDLITLQWSQIGQDTNGIAPLSRNSFGFSAAGQTLYVFGGRPDTEFGNEQNA